MLDRSLYVNHGPFVGLDEARFARAVADLFELFRPDMADDATGGVLIIRIDDREHVSLVGTFETYPPQACYRIAAEKLKRTRIMHRRHGHLSAWQSRNPARKKYAGAFLLAANVGVSFSGLSEHWDEVLLATAGWICGFLKLEDVRRLWTISSNPHLPAALGRLQRELLGTKWVH